MTGWKVGFSLKQFGGKRRGRNVFNESNELSKIKVVRMNRRRRAMRGEEPILENSGLKENFDLNFLWIFFGMFLSASFCDLGGH